LQLLDIAFAVVPDGLHPGIVIAAVAPCKHISSIPLQPSPKPAVIDMEGLCNMLFDEERPDPTKSVTPTEKEGS